LQPGLIFFKVKTFEATFFSRLAASVELTVAEDPEASEALDEAPLASALLDAVVGDGSTITAVASRVGDWIGLGIAIGLATALDMVAAALLPESIAESDTMLVVAPEPLTTTAADPWLELA
jgi:hypothetical protein